MHTETDMDDDSFLRDVTFPEEDRHLFTKVPWQGGYRWFRSPNVIPLERWKQRRQRQIEPKPDKAA